MRYHLCFSLTRFITYPNTQRTLCGINFGSSITHCIRVV